MRNVWMSLAIAIIVALSIATDISVRDGLVVIQPTPAAAQYYEATPPDQPGGEDITIIVLPDSDEEAEWSFETVLRVENDEMMVPIRVFAEALDATVSWEPPKTIIIALPDGIYAILTLTIGETLVVDNELGTIYEMEFSMAPVMRFGVAYAPLDDLAESFGYNLMVLPEDEGEVTLTPIGPSEGTRGTSG